MNYDVFKPDLKWASNQVNAIASAARQKGIQESEISAVKINCGNAPFSGWVILSTGDRVQV